MNDAYAHAMQVKNAMLNTRVLQRWCFDREKLTDG